MTQPIPIRMGRESIADRLAQSVNETGALAQEQVKALLAALAGVEREATVILAHPEAFAVGVVEIARRIAEDAATRSLTLQSLSARKA